MAGVPLNGTGVGLGAPRHLAASSLFMLLGIALGVFLLAARPAASEGLNEDQLKAAYLYNFARYVEWPRSAYASSDSALQIAVVGGGPVSDLLKKTVVGKTVRDRGLEVVDFETAAEARNSHILFVAGNRSKSELSAAIESLAGSHVFVVADADDFAKRGGIANFFVADNRVRFAINKDAASKAGLKVSSKLLRLAELVD